MRKKVYQVLEALYHEDIVSVLTCRLDGRSSRVRNEILELRKNNHIKIITIKGFVGRYAAYFLEDSDENINRTRRLLKIYQTNKMKTSTQMSNFALSDISQ